MREAVRECREVLCAVIAQVLRAEPIAERRVLVTEQRRAPERAQQSGGRAAFEQKPAFVVVNKQQLGEAVWARELRFGPLIPRDGGVQAGRRSGERRGGEGGGRAC